MDRKEIEPGGSKGRAHFLSKPDRAPAEDESRSLTTLAVAVEGGGCQASLRSQGSMQGAKKETDAGK